MVRFAAFGRILRAIDNHLLGSAMEKEVRRLYFLRSLPDKVGMSFLKMDDPVRYGTVELAIKRIMKEGIEGSFAEVGVWRGYTSRFIHNLAPERTLFCSTHSKDFHRKTSEPGRIQDSETQVST